MRRNWLILSLFLCLTIPLHAQDNPTPYDIALQRIQEAAATGATDLDLSDSGLTELPPEIGQLTGLQELSLGYNQLTSLPLEIGQLTNLERLSLDANSLTNLPLEIMELTSLQWLSLE